MAVSQKCSLKPSIKLGFNVNINKKFLHGYQSYYEVHGGAVESGSYVGERL